MREDLAQLLLSALGEIVSSCPRVVRRCYWAGTSAISIEELQHRNSFDIDLHTLRAQASTAPILQDLQQQFGPRFSLIETPNPYGAGFQGALSVTGGQSLTLQVMSNFQTVKKSEVVPSSRIPVLLRVGLTKYLRDKLTCLVERAEARDLVDVQATLRQRPDLEKVARKELAALDEVLLVERLLAWSDQAIAGDLKLYPEVDPALACSARDLLLKWVKA